MKQNQRVEDYMKIICRMQENGTVRGVDIARELGVSKPTVSIALKELVASGLIAVQPNRTVALTKEGKRIAHGVLARYEVLYGLLTDLGIDTQTAHEDACRMEHGLSDRSLKALQELRQAMEPEQLSAIRANA